MPKTAYMLTSKKTDMQKERQAMRGRQAHRRTARQTYADVLIRSQPAAASVPDDSYFVKRFLYSFNHHWFCGLVH